MIIADDADGESGLMNFRPIHSLRRIERRAQVPLALIAPSLGVGCPRSLAIGDLG